ncbi:MAG: hypothetical protein J3K34DRAFT_402344 [Monoraphidium minutum]|nr:MAG: hypothetical protein J3K34DRAFT_402344 [Monoraphidium minutum]
MGLFASYHSFPHLHSRQPPGVQGSCKTARPPAEAHLSITRRNRIFQAAHTPLPPTPWLAPPWPAQLRQRTHLGARLRRVSGGRGAAATLSGGRASGWAPRCPRWRRRAPPARRGSGWRWCRPRGRRAWGRRRGPYPCAPPPPAGRRAWPRRWRWRC